jgi:cytochrome b561
MLKERRSEMMNPVQKYTQTAVLLHWLIGGLIVVNVILGLGAGWIPDAWVRPVVDFHKSTGIVILGLVLLRILWRLTHRPPALPDHYQPWEKFAAHSAHYALYFLILAMPISGWIHDSAWSASASHPFYLFWIIPFPRLGFIVNLPPATKAHVHSLFDAIHTYLSYALYAVVGAHVLGALKHQFIDKHPEIQRMWR